jgi:aspartyl-tRNA(Asn)/glutamyl-tRNA(Gln) amidotransferase subunit A
MGDRERAERAVSSMAERFGIPVDDDAVGGLVDQSETVREQVTGVPAEAPQSEAASDVRPGDDEHNAFLSRFDLGGGEGPLSDLDVAVKDNLAVAGVEMTCGSAAVSFEPPYSATVVERLAGDGASVVATTNMDEFAYFTTGETCAHGRVRNPAAPGRVSGGSSAGSAAAVAAGAVDVALGSDTGGSVRIPAAFCGVVGLKPTHRAVPRFGFADLAPSLDHVGPLAADVRLAARAFDAIAGPTPADPSTLGVPVAADVAGAAARGVDGLRIGVVDPALSISTDAVERAVHDAADALRAAGATVDLVGVDGYETAPIALLGISGVEFAALFDGSGLVHGTGTGYAEPWRAAVADLDGDALGDNVREQLLVGAALRRGDEAATYAHAQSIRRAFTAAVDDALGTYDALLTPTTPITAPEPGAVTGPADLVETIANTAPFDLTGHPALSVPHGTVDGRPVGAQVVADRHDEPTTVAVGAVLADVVGPSLSAD